MKEDVHDEFDVSDPRTGATGPDFQISMLKAEIKKLQGLLWDAYAQWAYETSKGEMMDGGLSTLEDIREELGLPMLISREDFIARRREQDV